MENVKKIAQTYTFDKELSYKVMDKGLVNETWMVQSGSEKFILQGLCAKTIRKRYNVASAHEVLCDRIKNHEQIGNIENIKLPFIKKNKEQKNFIKHEGKYWLAYEYIDNDPIEKIDNELAFNLGKYLGNFHRLLQKEEIKPRYKIINFHDHQYYLDRLNSLYVKYKDRARLVETEYEIINNLKSFNYPKKSEFITIHGDPKPENFLIRNNEIVAVIDLESLMIGSRFIDIGDALRSLRNNNVFDMDLCRSWIYGYNTSFGKFIDIDQAIQYICLITLELAGRFLIDYFEEKYFRWDKDKFDSLAMNNLDRCQNELKYFKTII